MPFKFIWPWTGQRYQNQLFVCYWCQMFENSMPNIWYCFFTLKTMWPKCFQNCTMMPKVESLMKLKYMWPQTLVSNERRFYIKSQSNFICKFYPMTFQRCFMSLVEYQGHEKLWKFGTFDYGRYKGQDQLKCMSIKRPIQPLKCHT